MVIVAAVDRSDHGRYIVEEAETLAKAFDDEVHAVHVLSRSEFYDLERTSFERTATAVSVDQIKSIAADIARESTEQTNVVTNAVGLIGIVEDEVIRYANQVNARYIVIGPRLRSPTGKAVFGSAAQSILLNADRPIVTVLNE